jgi:hypothetical protein
MTTRRRNLICILLSLSVVPALLLTAGCKQGPATIVGSVTYLNKASTYQEFPPVPPDGTHSGLVDDDVAYVRLVDDSGAGATIWESAALDAGSVLLPFVGTATSDDGVYIDSCVITLTDAQITGATMPLRLEAFLYDAPLTGAFPVLNPAGDAGRYSEYDAAGEGNPQWYSLIDINVHEVKTSDLFATLPFPP